MKIEKLYGKYQGRVLEDWGCVCSKEFKQFASDIRSFIRSAADKCGGTLARFSTGHYDCSGFIQKGAHYVYFSYEPTRMAPINLDRSDPMEGVLYRTAKNERDFTGGQNHFTSLTSFETALTAMLAECCPNSSGN